MKCYIHNQSDAVGTCVGCGKFICSECNTEVNNKNYCKNCINELINDNKKKIEKLEDGSNQQPMVFMNAGGGSSSSSSSSSSSGHGTGTMVPLKSKVVAGLLAFFLGGFGIHKFYLGKPIQGILYILFCWTYVPSIIAFVEALIYFFSNDQTFAAKYGAKYV